MSIVMPKETGGDFELTPEGTFTATCYRLIDLGTQQIDWKGKIKHQHKIMLSWELTEELMQDGRPFSVHKRYTLSSSEKSNLRQDLESWRGAKFSDEDFGKFDVGNLIGKSCLMGIVHAHKDGKTYSNISSILRLPKGMMAPDLVNKTVYFSLKNFDQELYDSLSESLRAVIAKSPEYQEIKGAHRVESYTADDNHASAYDDEIPFG